MRGRFAATTAILAALAFQANARGPEMATTEPARVERPDPKPVSAAGVGERKAFWSLSPLLQWSVIPSPESDNHVAGYVDQYQYTPNKGSDVPAEIGVRDAALDLFRDGDTPWLQVRLESPSSNLGLSGSEIDEPFFNQKLIALTRLDGLDLDLRYHRTRSEALRLFPNTAGAGLLFDDRSKRKDRFFRDRTGFSGELRVRPLRIASGLGAATEWLAPEVSMRGGYQRREGKGQLRFHRNPSNNWMGLAQDRDRDVSQVGAGLLVAPGGLFMLALDFDHERFRFDSDTITDAELGFSAPGDTQAIRYIPSSDRYTGSARFDGRIGERAHVEGGFQMSHLEQSDGRTPDERSAGLDDVEVRYYSANSALDLQLSPDLSLRGFFKYDRRENDTSRSTSLFNPDNQVVPFVDHWERYLAGAEIELRLARANRVALGVRYEDVERDLEFATGALRIFRDNSLVDRDTEIISVYSRAVLRPLRALNLSAELGFRNAFETGYAVELDDNFYGALRASQVFALKRPLVLSAYLKGSTGENRDVRMVPAQGSTQTRAQLKRSYERWNLAWGITASHAPVDRLALFASLFYGRDHHDSSLDLSNFQRYFQNQGLDFARDGHSRFRNEQLNLIVGSRLRVDKRSDLRASYTFTRAHTDYRDTSTRALDLIDDTQEIDANVHGVDLELGHQLREGFRFFAGYRLQLFDDDTSTVQSIASARRPFDRSTHQHTVTVGVTITSDFLSP